MLHPMGRWLASMITLIAAAAGSEMPAAAQEPPAFGAGQQARPSSELLLQQATLSCAAPSPHEPFDPPTTSALPAAGNFPVRDYFRLDTSPAAAVAIAWLGATFAQRYGGKVESRVAETTLAVFALERASRDAEIIAALGNRHETQLSTIWCSLRTQAHGEPGALLTTAVPNIFYARDAAGVLGAIDVVWGGAGWEIGASRIDGTRRWPAGVRVLSRE